MLSPTSPSVRSRASSETMCANMTPHMPKASSASAHGTAVLFAESHHLGSPTVSSSKSPNTPTAGRFTRGTRSETSVAKSESDISTALSERLTHSRSESEVSAVSSSTDVGEVLDTIAGFPSPPLRMTVQCSEDEAEYGSAIMADRYRPNSKEGYNPDRRPSASSTLTVVSDSATVISGYERRDSTPSLSLVRTTSSVSAGPETPSFTSLRACEDFFAAPEKALTCGTRKHSLSNGEMVPAFQTGGTMHGIPYEDTFGNHAIDPHSPRRTAFAVYNTNSGSPTRDGQWVPPSEDLVDDWGEIEILDNGRCPRSHRWTGIKRRESSQKTA
ncbi:hypothetical protein NCC49_003283 [Naganishia albida]|nr:hypothetical protein NCC49_003283 [Naganishia albida]